MQRNVCIPCSKSLERAECIYGVGKGWKGLEMAGKEQYMYELAFCAIDYDYYIKERWLVDVSGNGVPLLSSQYVIQHQSKSLQNLYE